MVRPALTRVIGLPWPLDPAPAWAGATGAPAGHGALGRTPGRSPMSAPSLDAATSARLGREVELLHDARVGDLGLLVQLLDQLRTGRLEQAHAARFVGHEGAPDVANLLAPGRHLLARLDGGLLRRAQLIHRDALQAALHHVHGHRSTSLDRPVDEIVPRAQRAAAASGIFSTTRVSCAAGE